MFDQKSGTIEQVQAGDDDYVAYFETTSTLIGRPDWNEHRVRVLAELVDDLPRSTLNNDEVRTLLNGLGEPVAKSDDVPSCLRRWKLGHQVFDLLLDRINVALAEAVGIDSLAEPERMAASLAVVAHKYEASTLAFNYAADFSAADYADIVRPTMAPPNAPPAFSGTLNAKHRIMKERLKTVAANLNAAFGRDEAEWPESVREAYGSLLRAKTENLRNHGRICERFVEGGQSLLREYIKTKN